MADLYLNSLTATNTTVTSLNANSTVLTSVSTTALNLTSATATNLITTGMTGTNLLTTTATAVNLTITNNVASTNTSTGALVISGGLGISGTLYTYGFKFTNRAYGSVSGTGGQTVANTTATVLTTYWNGTPTTTGGMTFSGGLFTVPVSGIYIVMALVVCPTNSNGNERTSTVRINGFDSPGSVGFLSKPNIGTRTDIIIYNIFILNANDTVSVTLYQDSTATMTMETNFAGYFRVSQI